MKSMIVVGLVLVAVAAAVPVEVEPVKILKSNFDQQPDGAYNYGFEAENGIFRSETGEVKEALDENNKSHNVVVVRGSYGYINPEGVQETVNYIADEKGFNAEGSSIPQPPAGR